MKFSNKVFRNELPSSRRKDRELIFQPRTIIFNNSIEFEIIANPVVLDWVNLVGIEPVLIQSKTPYGNTLTIFFTMGNVVMDRTVIEFDPLNKVESSFLKKMVNQCVTPVTVIDIENQNRKISKSWELTSEQRKFLLKEIKDRSKL